MIEMHHLKNVIFFQITKEKLSLQEKSLGTKGERRWQKE